MVTLPLVLIGTTALLLNTILLPVIQTLMPTWQLEAFSSFCVILHGATVGCISLYLAIAVGYFYTQARNVKNVLLRLMALSTGIICFIILIGGTTADKFESYMGVTGVLPAIVVELIAISSFIALTNFTARNNREIGLGLDDNVKISSVTIIPMLLTTCAFVIFKYFAVTVLHIGDVYETLSSIFYLIFSHEKYSFLTAVSYTIMVHFLWIFGIHGGNVMFPISEDLLSPLTSNPDSIISKSFLDVFTVMGGCGCAACLLLALLIASRSHANKAIARSAAPMIMFNINELLVFGLPIIFNPIMMIPFITVPIMALVVAYLTTLAGFVPVITETINWATPILYGGYIATGGMSGVFLQLAILALGTLIYIPFVKLLDKFYEEKDLRTQNELISAFRASEESGSPFLALTRTDFVGQVARTMAHQLSLDVDDDKVKLYYQPQMNSSDNIVGAEALLRWKYQGKLIYPPFVIALAREAGVLNKATLQSAETICNTINDIAGVTGKRIYIALNMSARQLDDTELIDSIIAIATEKNAIEYLHLELTEETSLIGFRNIDANLHKLSAVGIMLAIDDFGMGQTSINYLREHNFKYVKIDGSLVRQILDNPRCTQIISSIIELGHSLNYKVVAEYVSTIEIKEKLMEMGCSIFQGYYYSPAIPKEDFMDYCKKYIKNDNK